MSSSTFSSTAGARALAAAGTLPPDLAATLAQLLTFLDALPPGDDSLDSLKKPGAWRDKPLKTATPEIPIWVQLPTAIDFEGMSSAQVQALKAEPAGSSSTVSVGLKP